MFGTVRSATRILLGTFVVVSASRGATPAVVSVEEAIKAIRAQEDAVHTLRATGEWHMTSWEKGAWVIKNDQVGTVTYGGVPAVSVRMDCEKDVWPWEAEAPGALYFRAFTMVYNGRVGLTLKTQEGKAEKPENTSELRLADGAPAELDDASRTSGWRYSIFGAREADKLEERQTSERFSTFLARNREKAVEVHEEGMALLKLTVNSRSTGNDVETSYWLDPVRGYSIVKWEGAILPDRKARGTFHITGFYTPAPNVYYPKGVSTESGSERNGSWAPSQKNTLEIRDVRVNAPDVNWGTFMVRVSPDTVVVDPGTGAEATVREIEKQKEGGLKRQFDDARGLIENVDVPSSGLIGG